MISFYAIISLVVSQKVIHIESFAFSWFFKSIEVLFSEIKRRSHNEKRTHTETKHYSELNIRLLCAILISIVLHHCHHFLLQYLEKGDLFE